MLKMPPYRASRIVGLPVAAGLAVASCTAQNSSPAAHSEGSAPGPPTTTAHGDPPSTGTVVNVQAGRFTDEAMMPTLLDYLQARQESMRQHAATADLVATSTYQWLQQQRVAIATAQQRGWTVPQTATVTVQRVESGSVNAVVGVCLWAPSVDFVDERTGHPVRRTPVQWYPFDVKMVRTSDRWLVAEVARGNFGCKKDTR